MKGSRLLMITAYLTGIYALDISVLGLGFIMDASMLIRHALMISLCTALFSIPLVARISRISLRETSISFLISVAIYSCCFLLTMGVFDVSSDGQTYHLQTVADLAEGWNPARTILKSNDPNNIFIQHYGKAYEYAAFSFYSLTGKVEGAKLFNIILLLSSFLLLVYNSRFIPFSAPPFLKYSLAVLICCNPLILYQLFTFYVDGQLFSCFVLLLAGIYGFLHERRQGVLILFPVIIILFNVKFTGLVYGMLILLFGLSCYLVFDRKLVFRYLVLTASAALVAVLVAGYNPYVRNTLEHHHPFYPLMGKEKVDITNDNILSPESFAHRNVFEKLLISNLAVSHNKHGAVKVPEPKLKIPFTFSLKEWVVFKSNDVRMGGAGPLWSGILLLSLIAFAYITIKREWRFGKACLLLSGFLLVSVIMIPEGWYFRYAPQIWLIACLALFMLMNAGGRFPAFLSRALSILMLLNILGIFIVNVSSAIIITQEIKSELRWMKGLASPPAVSFNGFIANKMRLDDRKIPYRELAADPDTLALPCKSFEIPNSKTIVFYPKETADYQPIPLFQFLSDYVKARKHAQQ